MALSAWLIAHQRDTLSPRLREFQQQSDGKFLLPPDQMYVASLGYRSALADLIYGHVLVAYGLHFQEKRLFEYVGDYLDVINRLDPKFRDPYRLADTLLTLQPRVPPVDFYRKAREVQERGLRELPNDQELWLTVGQFLAYIAPPQLPDELERREYKDAGARYLMHACELVGSNEQIPYNCLTAAALLNEQGNLVAVRQFLERVVSVSDNPEIQQIATDYLRRVAGEQAKAEVQARTALWRNAWQADLPFVPRQELSSLAPRFDSATCAGLTRASAPECATSWSAWSERTSTSLVP
jgi:hypothetical protein